MYYTEKTKPHFMKVTNFNLICLLLIGGLMFVSCKKEVVDPITGPETLGCDDFKSARTLVDNPDEPVDYYIDCVMDVEAAITVQPGVVIEFGPEAGINVTTTGSFNARGTAASHITFRGSNPVKGHWKGILFNSASSSNALHHLNLQHAGSSTFNTNGDVAAVIIWAQTKLDLQHLSISQSGNHGISAIYTQSDWSISNSRISTCDNAPAVFLAPYIPAFDGSNDFTGNAKDYLLIDLATEAVNASFTWRKSSVPWRVTSTYSNFLELRIATGTVTIEPGVAVAFEQGLGMLVDEDATLIARGTPTERIRFTGATSTAGAWSSIYFDANTSAANEISYADIEYAGATQDGENCGVLMRVDPILKLDNVAFSNIAGCSIFNMSTSANPNLSSSNLSHNNTGGTICNY